MDAHCVGIAVVPVCPMGCDRIHGRLLSTKRHASSFVNRPAAMRPQGERSCLSLAPAEFTKGKIRYKFCTLFPGGTLSSPLLRLLLFKAATSLTDIRTSLTHTTCRHLGRIFNKVPLSYLSYLLSRFPLCDYVWKIGTRY